MRNLMRVRWRILVGVILAGWVIVSAAGVINRADVRWFADDPRVAGSCEAAAWLKSVRASRGNGSAAITADAAREQAVEAIAEMYPDVGDSVTISTPIPVRGRLGADGEQSAWVVVASLGQNARLSHAALVVIDSENGEVIRLAGIAGAVDPNLEGSCPPPTMRAILREIAVSPPVIAMGAYVAVVGIGAGIVWWRKRNLTP